MRTDRVSSQPHPHRIEKIRDPPRTPILRLDTLDASHLYAELVDIEDAAPERREGALFGDVDALALDVGLLDLDRGRMLVIVVALAIVVELLCKPWGACGDGVHAHRWSWS